MSPSRLLVGLTVARFLGVLALLMIVEFAVFEWRAGDLIYLNRPVAVLREEPRDRFQTNAERALARPTLTRAKLETIAQTAVARNDSDLAIRSLDRLSRQYQADPEISLRLGEALRNAGRLEEAKRAYQRAARIAAQR
jgi:tetratricopeptide (TPR) repeat protein